MVGLFLLSGCSGGSDDPFVKEMTSRMAKKMEGFDESVIENCIEEKSSTLSDEDKETILALLNNPDGNQDFTDMSKIQGAMELTMAFSSEMLSCAMKNK